MSLNKKITDFTVAMTGQDKNFKLSEHLGKNIVLFFYPKDDTPGCTIEGHEFTALLSDFEKNNTLILGVSRDSIQSHEKFRQKFSYMHHLLADTDGILCDLFNVMGDKKMFGKVYQGINRSTFLINPEGVLVQEWREVTAKGHAQEVLQFITNM